MLARADRSLHGIDAAPTLRAEALIASPQSLHNATDCTAHRCCVWQEAHGGSCHRDSGIKFPLSVTTLHMVMTAFLVRGCSASPRRGAPDPRTSSGGLRPEVRSSPCARAAGMGGGVEGGGRCRYQSVVHNTVHARLTWRDTLWRIFPAGAAASFDIGLSNASLATNMHINLYTIGKSTVVCFVLLFAIVFRILR